MTVNTRKYLAVMFFWLSIFTLFAYPKGLPLEQWISSMLMALASGILLSLEKEEAKHD